MKTKLIAKVIPGLCLAISSLFAYSQESKTFKQLMNSPAARNQLTIPGEGNVDQTVIQTNSTFFDKINDATDIRIFPTANLQISPNISINKQNPNSIVISAETYNPSISTPLQGYFYSTNGGTTWNGSEQVQNTPAAILGGKPRTAFNNSNRAFILGEAGSGFFLQSSTNAGATWSPMTQYFNIVDNVSQVNMIVDNEPTSPYVNRYYGVWTLSDPGGPSKKVLFHKSTDNGINFTPSNTFETVLKVGYNSGTNVQTGPGPNGNVYVCWSDRSTATPYTATGLGFCRSTDGGVTFTPYQKVLNYQGFGNGVIVNPTFNNTIVFDNPSMAVDKSQGARRGRIYVAVAAKENGNGKGVVQVSYSDNQGTTWSTLNTISIAAGRQNWSPFITVDDCTGEVWVIYYSFDTVSGYTTNTYVARSVDGGVVWENQKISDLGHITAPVPGSTIYAGYQIGIAAYGGKAHAVWSDNRTGGGGNWQLYYSPVTGSSESNITGNATMCTLRTYSLTGFPPTATVTWSVNTTSPQVTLTPNGQSVAVASNGYLGTCTLTATVVNGCGTYRYTKSIQVIPGTTPTQSGQQATCKHQFGSFIPMTTCNKFLPTDLFNPCPDGVVDPCYFTMQGTVTDPIAVSSYAIAYRSPLSSATLTVSGNVFTVTCRRWPSTSYVVVGCTTTNSCGSAYKEYTFHVSDPCPGPNPEFKSIVMAQPDQEVVSRLTISPNPSTGQFMLKLNTDDKTSSIKEVIITNKMGTLVYQQKFYTNQKMQNINLSDQPTDTYMVKLFDGKEWHTQKLALRR